MSAAGRLRLFHAKISEPSAHYTCLLIEELLPEWWNEIKSTGCHYKPK